MKPNVVVSRCLEFAACRYNAQKIPDEFVRKVKPFVNFITICPELEIGLGAPRDPVRLVDKDKQIKMMQLVTERDLTEKMNSFSDSFLGSLSDIDGFILKSRSPSCGTRDVKLYPGTHKVQPSGRGQGLFGGAVVSRFGHLAVEEESRLNNPRIRDHYLTKLFLLSRFRKAHQSGKMKDLVNFHSSEKFLLMAYNKKVLSILGRITANPEKKETVEVFSEYETELVKAFVRAPRYTSMINTFQHVLGFFKKQLSPGEKEHFLNMLDNYRSGIVLSASVISLLKSWTIRFDTEYLKMQTFFNPYPEKLMNIVSERPLEKDYWKHN